MPITPSPTLESPRAAGAASAPAGDASGGLAPPLSGQGGAAAGDGAAGAAARGGGAVAVFADLDLPHDLSVAEARWVDTETWIIMEVRVTVLTSALCHADWAWHNLFHFGTSELPLSKCGLLQSAATGLRQFEGQRRRRATLRFATALLFAWFSESGWALFQDPAHAAPLTSHLSRFLI
jgi:hypothetical protein